MMRYEGEEKEEETLWLVGQLPQPKIGVSVNALTHVGHFKRANLYSPQKYDNMKHVMPFCLFMEHLQFRIFHM